MIKTKKTVKCHFHVRVHVHFFGTVDDIVIVTY